MSDDNNPARPVTGDTDPHRRKIYGRRKGKALRASQERLVAGLLPRLAVPGVAPEGDRARVPVDLVALFGDMRPVWLEIGFGGGEHLAHQAGENPETGIIGCEPFINGMAMALGRLEREGARNVRLHMGDARDLIELLPDGALERVFLLYPDPWPKKRHHKRRFMSPENLRSLYRVMKPGATLRLATDIPGYVEHALEAVGGSEGFEVLPGADASWSEPWGDWPGTRYEAKALREDRRPHYLTFVRS